MSTDDPRASMLRDLLDALGTLDFERVGRMVATDAVFEFPYGTHPPLRGREAIVAFLNASMAGFVSEMTFTVQAVHPAEDPELAFAEYTSVGRLTNGGAYANRYVAALRVRDGLICEFKEFYNPAAIATSR
jgi:ketosteroid isomerase-like protein